ncbi:MAG: LapA family protein [Desulfobaccales bacterium]
MTKVKVVALLAFGAALAIFTVQNWQYPTPPVHFLGFQFLPLPMSLIILGFFGVGFLAGFLTCVVRAKRRAPEEAPAPPQEEQGGQ